MLGVLGPRVGVARRRLLAIAGLVSLAPFALAGHAFAQDATAVSSADSRPGFQKLRYDDDFSFLKDPAKRSDFWDPIKYIPLDPAGNSRLSVGGELRERYERYNNFRWNPESPDTDGYLLQRFLLHADLRMGDAVRVFAQIQSSLEDWRAGGPRGTDENRLDLHQAFVDVRVPVETSTGSLTLRVGRQEMAYGSQRLISVRDSPNIRRSFDAMRVLTAIGDWRVDGFLSRPVEDDRGTFDDDSDDQTTFWGIYATAPVRSVPGAKVDVYYLGLRRRDATFVDGTADELRHSLGARVFGAVKGLDYNFEGVVQWGRFGGRDIRAWTLASDTGYTFDAAAFAPRIGLRVDAISGDTSRGDGTLGTFNALFPRGAYFGEISLIGPANVVDVHPTIDLKLTDRLKLSADWDFFWRYSTSDGLYDSGSNVVRNARGGDSRFIGHQPSVGVEWALSRHTTVNAVYSHFFAGDFIRESGPAADVDFLALWMTYRF